MGLNLDETVHEIDDDVTELPGVDAAVASPDPPSQQHDRERQRLEISEEDLNDDDVSVDDRLDVASLGDGSDDEIIKSADEDDCPESPFSRDVIVPLANPSNDVILDQRSLVLDDQVGSLIFTNQVRLRFSVNGLFC